MNVFVSKNERVHFSFDKLNIVGDAGMSLIFAPKSEWKESELKYIPDSLIKIFPMIGKETVAEFYVYDESTEGFPKSFTSKKFIGIAGFIDILEFYNFIEEE